MADCQDVWSLDDFLLVSRAAICPFFASIHLLTWETGYGFWFRGKKNGKHN